MKVGIDARFYRKETAGIGRYSRGLISSLAKIDQKNDYYIFLTAKDLKEYDIRAKNFHPVLTDITHYTLSEQTKFLSILKKYNFDLVHFLNFNHPIFYNRPFVTTVHDLTMLLFPVGRSQKSIIRKLAFKKVMSHAVKSAKRVITVSKSTKKDILKYIGGNAKNIQVVYEAFDDIYHNHYSQQEIKNTIKKYNLSDKYLLFVSQWRPHKGLPQLISAFEVLKKKYKIPHQLVITGKPNADFPEIIAKIKTSANANEIITPGFVKEIDLPKLYADTSCFVFPSFYEGFGLGPLEAMACGAPIASSNLSCMPEILGQAPIYFNPANIQDLSDAIYKIISNQKLANLLRQKGLKQAAKYSWQKMAQETLDIYKNSF